MLITDAPQTELSYDSEDESQPENLKMLTKDDCKMNINLDEWFSSNKRELSPSIA
tara:strand:+ start:1403 stop:1567 length:165 start_codon:yes stop_codon:yes gene_type:complete